ncbi:MAG: poly(3-hydroxybutyrate) depolymerase [Myxococcota bacterium]
MHASWLVTWIGCGGTSDALDSGAVGVPDCAPGERRGSASGSDDRRTPDGVRYTVRVPDRYDPTVAHPLVVVYAPAGGDPELTESFTGLTDPLTGEGFVVAYADHVSPSSTGGIEDLGTIPRRVARRWCIDEARVHFTGHSDGGSVATLLAVSPGLASIRPASIAPSAAGTNGAFLAGQSCPVEPRPVMVLHSDRDALFPGYGAEAAAWWAACNGCGSEPGDANRRGCRIYPDCPVGGEVQYCEHTGSHGSWPGINRAMVDFFLASGG